MKPLGLRLVLRELLATSARAQEHEMMVSVVALLVTLPLALVMRQRKLPPRPEIEVMLVVGVLAPETLNVGVAWLLLL